jgi:hypothetical protein
MTPIACRLRPVAALALVVALGACRTTTEERPFGTAVKAATEAQKIDRQQTNQPVTGVEGERSLKRFMKADQSAPDSSLVGASTQPQ